MSDSSPTSREIPFAYSGDSYILDVAIKRPGHIHLLSVTKFPMNKNYGEEQRWFDLSSDLRERILQQIQRIHRGYIVHV